MYDRNTLKDIPHQPGIYMYFNHADDVIYVGKAKNLHNRVRQYFQNEKNLTPKTRTLVSHIDHLDVIVVDNETEALILECNLIKKYRPRYNIMLKDDKNYPFIKMTVKDNYPKIIMTRRHVKDGSKYFGPFTNSGAVRQTIEAINKVYQLRRCNQPLEYGKKRGRPCLNYHIGQCMAPCTGKVTRERYFEDVNAVMDILNGKDKLLTARLTEEMNAAVERLDFETAAQKRDQIQGIAHIAERQKMISENEQDQDYIAYVTEEDLACVLVLNVRDGKMIGRNHRYLEGVEGSDPEKLMAIFVKQYYSDRTVIPKELVLNSQICVEERGAICEWLRSIRGSNVILTLPQKGQKEKLIKMAEENARLTLAQYLLEQRHKQEKKKSKLDGLRDLLDIDDSLRRIEAYDISNISGTDNVGGMVVFTDGKADKKAYRRFKIKSVEGQNDYGSMQEMLFRRMERGMKEQKEGVDPNASTFLPFPEVICIDGGKTHVEAAQSIMNMYPEIDARVIGLVKDDHHHLRGIIFKGEEYPLTYGTPMCTFLSEISEEVHRFAITYHRQLRNKNMLASELETIPGIGPKRREALMWHFVKTENLLQASSEEIAAVQGMDHRSAQAVFEWAQKKKQEKIDSHSDQSE